MVISHKTKVVIGIIVMLILIVYANRLSSQSGQVYLLDINGPIGPATRDYIVDGIEQSEANSAELIIIRIDTPGGLSESMRDIIKKILNSEIPVAAWVGPAGSRAASAGTYIMYACHISAMAPSTHLGAATPVPIGGGVNPFERLNKDKNKDQNAEQVNDQTADKNLGSGNKAIEDAVAYIRSLAESRNRNADWAESAVRTAATLSAEQALKSKVIDLMAVDIDSLLNQIDGRSVQLTNQTKQLSVKDLTISTIRPNWKNQFLATITNPSLAYMLLLIGIYGLVLEGYNPGALVPGVIGAVCLLLALYAFQILPVNFSGLALIFLGFSLITIEFFVPAFGILGIGGLVSLTIGSIILMDTDVPGFGIPLGLISGVAITAGLLFAGIMYVLAKAFRKPLAFEPSQIIGQIAEVISNDDTTGLRVHINGEDWQAKATTTAHQFQVGDQVKVEDMQRLTLAVKPLEYSND